MRIAHLTSYFHPAYYGSHEAFLTRALVGRGHEVVIYTSDRMPRWGGAAGLDDERLPVGADVWEGAVVRRFRAGPTVGFVPSLPGIPAALADEGYDLFLGHELFSLASFHGARAARRAARPFVLVQHGYHGGRRLHFRALFQANLATTGGYTLRRSAAAVALTGAAARFLHSLRMPEERVEVIPTGVDTERFRPRPGAAASRATGGLRVGFVGRLEPEKGIETLVRAFARAFPLGDGTLSFVGEGSAAGSLPGLFAAHRLEGRARLLGRLAHELIPAFLHSLDFLVVPTIHAEPFGIVAVEAAACGLPVVASSIGGLAETVVHGKTGLLVPPNDEDGLAHAMRVLGADPGRRAAFGAEARLRAETRYAWPRVAAAFEELFASLVAVGTGAVL